MPARDIETIYRLAPMQEGMLFHSLSDPELGLYVEQAACVLEGELDAPGLRRAWERVVAHHPALRASFHWREVERPVQVVHRTVAVPWREEDWRDAAGGAPTPGAEAARFGDLLAADRRRGFDLESAPLLRLTLARTGERRWRFLWSYHHLLLDGWSLLPVLRQVFDAYGAELAGTEPELPPARPYVDYIAWLEARDTPAERARDEAFWRRELAGFRSATPLPGTRPGGAAGGGTRRARPATEARHRALPRELSAGLERLAARAGVTSGTVLQAAWALLLARAAGEDDVVFGAVVSGRPAHLAGADAMVGLFVNTLPVRVRIDEDLPLASWLRRLQGQLAELREHEHSPLARVQRWSDVEPGEPLFESLVAFENYPRDPGVWQRVGGLVVRDLTSEERTNFPLDLAVVPGDELLLELTFDPGTFEPGTPERLLDWLEALLRGMAAAPDAPLAGLSLLGEEDERRVVLEWSGAVAPELPADGSPATIHGLVAERVRRHPEAVAVAAPEGGREWTYGELWAASGAVAATLRRHLPARLIAVLIERSAEAYAALLGVLRTGAAYLPLDPDLPDRRVLEVLADAGVEVVVTRRALGHRLAEAPGLRPVFVEELGAPEGGGPDPVVHPEAAAYVVYTSGSTGRPKGVVATHRAVVNLLRSERLRLALGPATRTVQLASLGFDASVAEVFITLAWGGRVIPLERETLLSPPALARALRRSGATLLFATPSLLAALAPEDFPTLERVGSGADRCPAEVAARWSAVHRFWNDYGPTEGTVYCLRHEGPGGPHGPPLGRPIAGARVHVLDRRLRPVPAGVPGEILLGGKALARGYLDRPALTAERFVPDPFAGRHRPRGERLYRTGDLGRFLPDGSVEFVGRIDHQVKVRGHRVECGEVEAVLRGHPAVAAAAVVAQGEAPHKRLAAFLVVRAGAARPEVEDLRGWLGRRLPEAMVPAGIEWLDELPHGATGKIDRRALVRREVGAPAPAGGRAPAPGLETALAQIWGEVLGVDAVAADDDFFRLGGDSIVAIRAIARAAEEGIELTPRRLFENPTVARLAAALEELAVGPDLPLDAPPPPPDRPDPARAAGEEAHRLLPLQEGMLYETLRRPGEGVYLLQLACRLEGSLDVSAFERAWRETVARHLALRTSFHWEGLDHPRQVVHREAAPPFVRVDWRGLLPTGPEGEERRFAELVAADRKRGFDLGRAPLLRLTLVELGAGRFRLLWTHHHLILDGWSGPLVLREVLERYRAARSGGGLSLPPAAPFRGAVEHALRHRREGSDAVEAHWRRELGDLAEPPAVPLPEPMEAPTGAPGGPAEGRHVLLLPEVAGEATADLARRQGLTLATVVQAAWALALCRWAGGTGPPEAVVGVVVSGRPPDLPGVETMVGSFIDTVPLRVRADDRTPVADWLRDLRARLAAAEEHGPASPVEIRTWAGLPRDRPLFEAVVAFENYPLDRALEAGLEGVAVTEVRHFAREALPLALTAMPGERLELHVTFDRRRVDGEAARRLLEQTAALVEALPAAAAAGGVLGGLPDLPEGERRRLVAEWPDGGGPPELGPGGESAAAAFRARAAAAPDAPALHLEAGPDGRPGWLSYGALARRVSRLAAALRAAGAGPETPVAVLPTSAAEAVVGCLAALEAGAVYVPLEPEHPPERLAWILRWTCERAFPGAPAHLLVARPERAAALTLPEGLRRVDPGAPGPGERRRPWEPPPPEAAAYLIYTSGSTGEPHGVAVSHGALARHLAAVRRAYGLGTGDRVLQVQSLAFDASVEQILSALTAGACLYPRGGRPWGPAEILVRLERWRLTVANLPTALWQEVGREAGPERRRPALPALRLLLVGGEAMPAAAARRWREGPAAGRLVNAYGPTEAVVTATLAEVEGPSEGQRAGSAPVGRPLAGRRAYVLGGRGRPVPEGGPGELCLGGVLARGYAGRPALTAERFVPDPFAGEPGGRLLRTGDRARWLPGGRLQVLGRLDDQVKVRGFRVEPAEVEAALSALPGVTEAVVAPRGGDGGTELVAWVVAAEGGTSGAALRAELARRLPGHLVPAAVAVVPSLARTATGKIDRRALPAPSAGPVVAAGGNGGGGAPRTALEAEVAAVWSRVLGVPAVGRDDRFFDLGGHSLLAMRAVSYLREALGVELPLATLFERPTVAELAREVEAALRSPGGEAPPPLRPRPRPAEGPVPASPGQERLWFLDRLDPGSSAYNLPLAVRLRGALDAGALEGAVAGLIARHESLRTGLVPGGGGWPEQRIAPAAAAVALARLAWIDLARLPEAARRAEARRLAAEAAERPFDLARPPLFRAFGLRLDASEHLLLLTLHHAVSDEWSLAVMVGELAALYRGVPEEPPPVQYADWSLWQREWLGSEGFSRDLAWWRERLAGAPGVAALPTDRPRPAARSDRGGRVPVRLGAELADRLRTVAREGGATPFMLLLAAVQAWLWRHGAGDDLVVGTPVANRTHPETEGVIGFFVNTVAVRTGVAGDPPFAELLARARRDALDALGRQAVPFERVVEAVAPGRSPAHAPVVQVMLALHTVPLPEVALDGLTLEPVPVPAGTAKLDLLLELTDGAAAGTAFGGTGEIAGGLEYAADLFDASTAERLAAHLVRLLEGVAEDPGRRLSELPLLSAAELRQLTAEWSGPARRFPAPRPLHERFARWAEERPDAVAVAVGREAVSYGELRRRAGALAARLRNLGVGPESRVGLLAERSAELVAGVLGILEAGAAYVPLDPRYPAERLAYVLEDAGVEVVVVGPAGDGEPPPTPGRIRVPVSSMAPPPPDAARAPLDPECASYVIHTSGSTGRPKGVVVTHGNAARLFRATEEAFAPGPEDAWTLFHSPAFDFSVWELWGALAHGGRLEVVPYWASRSPEALLELLAARRVTVLCQTPSAFRGLAEIVAEPHRELPALRRLVFGGERLEPAALAGWLNPGERLRAANLYGITETTVHVTLREMAEADLAAPWRSPVGRALPDLACYVLEPSGRPAAAGVPGELLVGGDGLARGYLGRPGLTAERFVPDALSGSPGARLYRSGDLARWLPWGELEYLGRIDQQVKVRGFRIEPGEVEAALEALPQVLRAVVVARQDLPGGGGLVAYAVPAEGASPGEGELRTALGRSLPEYMVPVRLVVLPALPLTPSGKVDRRALPAPGGTPAGEGARVAPRTDLERTLAGIWSEVLGLEAVGVEESFFDLGGHSLLATRVVARVREALAVEVPLRELFARPTVAALAETVARLGPGTEPAGAGPVPRRADPAHRPLAPAQERLWFLDRFGSGSAALVISADLRLRGRLDPAALAWSLAAVRRRHETLRSSYPEVAGRPVQRVHASAVLPLPAIDLSAIPPGCRGTEAGRLAAADAARPFRVAGEPLVRALLLRFGPEEHLLHLAVHHLVADGWSLGVLVREVTELYRARAAGEAPALPDLPVQYADYAAWLRDRLDRGDLEGQVAHWRRRLEGAPPHLDLPTDRPRPPFQSGRGRRVARELPPALAGRLRALARAEDASPFMLLLAGLGLVLGRWAGQEEVVVGAPVAGRTRRELEGLVGLFLNHLALRLDLRGGAAGPPSFRELLRRARAVALEAFEHQEAPFERVLEALFRDGSHRRDLSRTPVFQVYLNVLNFPLEEAALPGLTVEPWGAPGDLPGFAQFDLELYVAEPGGAAGPFRLELAYDEALFDRWRADELLAELEGLLADAAARPDAPAAAFSLVTDRARRALPDPAAPLSDAWKGPIHARLARWGREAPDRTAVAWEGGAVSYGRLAAAVEALAGRLARAGVGRGDRVAVLAHRSPALVAAVLGVLRAGAAFVLLDPAYPSGRNALCVARARPRAWLGLAAAGPVPDEVAARLDGLPDLRLRLDLPPLEGPGSWLATSDAGAPVPSPPEVGPEDAAYVAFTSGSTGEPKGVVGRHRSLTHFLPWQERAMALGAGDRFSLLSGLAHDPLHRDVFTAVWCGAAIAVPDGERTAEPGWLAAWMARAGVTVAHLTPALGRVLTEVPEGAGLRLDALRRALFVGDLLPRRTIDELRRLAPSVRPIGLYGATETQRAVGWWEVEEEGDSPDGVVPLGRGMPGVQLLVVGEGGGPAGIGEVGEVQVRSPHLAAGYLDDPALTAERFVPDAGDPAGGARRYRTGDLGRYRGDGAVEPLGRADRQVQVRGFRVEPGEVEAALERHPAVGRAAVVARGGAQGPRLVGYLVPRAGAGLESLPGAPELRRFLAAWLPAYMVPAAFVPLAALPLTPNRKLDRSALPDPPAPESEERGGPVAAGNADPTAELVARLWEEVLEAEGLGAGSDFFELGGHSLQVTRVLARVRDTLGVELPVRSLFEHSTVAAFARRVEAARRDGGASEATALPPPLRAVPRRPAEELPASFGQERMWLLHRLDPGATGYHLGREVALRGELDVAALGRALGGLLARHEALRTGLVEREDRPVQRLAASARLPLPVADLSALPPGLRETEAARLAAALARRPFDLSRPPLVRVLLVRLAPAEHRFALVLHHAVTDGWSMGVVVRDLGRLYREASGAGPAGLPAPPVQYPDWAVWQREWLRGDVLERELAWWRARLDPPPEPLELPADRPRPERRSGRGHRVALVLPPSDTAALRALARRHGATPFMVLLAAFQALLGRWSGSAHPAVGTPVANRRDPRLEAVVGFFVNTLVLVGDLADDPGFREHLARVRRDALDAFAHQDLPFERLVEELRPVRDRSRPPLFQAMLALQNMPRPAGEPVRGLALEVLPPAADAALFDLAVALADTASGALAGFLEADADLFDAATAARMGRHLGTLVRGALAAPSRRLSELPLLPPAERHQVLVEWPAAPESPGALEHSRRLLHLAFEERAAGRPDAVAVVQPGPRGERAWSYGALAAAARDLARRLGAVFAAGSAGEGPEPRVGIALERSPEQIAAIFGALAAGAAYVPLDPGLPPERVGRIAAEAGLAAVVTGSGGPPAGLPPIPVLPVGGHGGGGRPEAPAPAPAIDGDRLAYILFTSGSTGTPKGVMISHAAAAAYRERTALCLGLGPGSRQMQVAPLSFDASVAEIFPVLGRGGTLVLREPGPFTSTTRLEEDCRDHRVEVVALATTLWHELAASDAPLPPSLRRVLFGGERALAERVARWRRRAGPAVGLLHVYGPTETTVQVVNAELGGLPAPSGPAGDVPLGRPEPGCRVDLVDARGRPVPAGVAGEIWIGGTGVARGYVGDPARTAGAFVPDPFSGRPGGRLYRSGDLARRLADGTLVFQGRVDRQVKVRGIRVEPGEVESALVALPGVGEAAVDLRRGPGGAGVLVAWVSPGEGDGRGIDPERIRELLAERLPAWSVPGAVVPVPALPRTPSGKVDRRALPDPGPALLRRGPGGGRVAPRTALERDIAAVWEEVLDVPRVGVTDDFFDLGGHSLLAVRLAARLEERLARPLPMARLFEHPTVESLAAALRDGGGAPAVRLLLPLRPAPPAGPDRPPLVLVHPAGGSGLCYTELAEALEPGRPVWALQAPGLEGEGEPLDRVELLAERYLGEIEAELGPLGTAGTVHLGGWSFGALVAFEMARRLAGRGGEAEVVALDAAPLGTDADGGPGDEEHDEAALLARALADVLPVGAEELRRLDPAERVDYLVRLAGEPGVLPPDLRRIFDPRVADRLLRVFGANLRAAERYRPEPSPVRVVLLRAEESRHLPERDPGGAWRRVALGGVEVVRVPGDHRTLVLGENARTLARALDRCLDAPVGAHRAPTGC